MMNEIKATRKLCEVIGYTQRTCTSSRTETSKSRKFRTQIDSQTKQDTFVD